MNSKIAERFILGKVIAQKEWRLGLNSLYVDAAIEPFVAGQFTQLALDEDCHVLRPYSFVNPPSESPFEFYYSLVPGGYFSSRLVKLKPHDPIYIAKRPSGRFVLSSVPDATILWLFATGTGFGVFLSILQTQQPWLRFQKIVLVHSVQNTLSLTHQHLVQLWQHQYPERFYWMPVVTGENLSDGQRGAVSKRITHLLASGELENQTGLSLSAQTSQTMLCGNPAMIHDLSELLKLRGLLVNHVKQPGQITIENYWKLDNKNNA
ncbi:ferredoxin--NADP reductase [Candidatus Berkiella aquae]|uniref:ferredoxin--NADP(+) reductase n=1 Tax=Candidatus Berkiella aquae TaxID=295108 RepID=A0A0Q9YMV2_9GAMM|nr:ferredoxin--NADP reductase [Candidatus Berkiella aquae]MCS5712695.1 ferredoxin--NADP reductase [Candidatus Berkiella aquae]